MPAFDYAHYPYAPAPEERGERPRHAVCIVGAGPVGLTLALDLASRGIASVVLKDGDTVSEGSRALCWSERTLDILDRFGIAAEMRAMGFTWNQGRVYFRDAEVYRFDLQPEGGRKHPAFVNLQQYHAETLMVRAAERQPLIDLRWQHKALGARQAEAGAVVAVRTPAGTYELAADWVVACDGARSTIRRSLGLDFAGRVFEDQFLIADIDVGGEVPAAERRFWFDPPFHHGPTALMHRQGDGMWRVDFQIGPEADAALERQPARVEARCKAMLGDRPIAVHWASVYTFQARRLDRFRHHRVIFAGDAAHQVSPFGARGGNAGVQDADNLGWKLACAIQGTAGAGLLDSYDAERGFANDEHIRVTSRTTNFIAPQGPVARTFRDAVLQLARDLPFARALVNSGRLSTATVHADSPLSTLDEAWIGGIAEGAPLPNLALDDGYLLDRLHGSSGGFRGLHFAGPSPPIPADPPAPLRVLALEPHGPVAAAFAATPGTFYLVRPDQHVAARWRNPTPDLIRAAMIRALGG